MPNRYIDSRQSKPAFAPFLTVYLGAADKAPPAAPAELRGEKEGRLVGETYLSWTTPKDDGPAGTVGFFVRVDDKEVPRYLIPAAGKPGERVRMRLRDLNLTPGATVHIAVRAADGAGNVGPAAEAQIQITPRPEWSLPGKPVAASSASPALCRAWPTPRSP